MPENKAKSFLTPGIFPDPLLKEKWKHSIGQLLSQAGRLSLTEKKEVRFLEA